MSSKRGSILPLQSGDQASVRAELEHSRIREMSIEEEEGSQEDEHSHRPSGGNRRKFSVSEKINNDLDEASAMLEKLTQSLFPEEMGGRGGRGGGGGGGGGGEGSGMAGVVKRVHKDWRKSRHSTVSSSISEPDLTLVCPTLYIFNKDTHIL